MRHQKRREIEFGDFQTPLELAREICFLIARTGFDPASILEPTCGLGSFLKASLETFPNVRRILGFEINSRYVKHIQDTLVSASATGSVEVYQSDFFAADWPKVVASLPDPLLVIGNPPWVTNAVLGALGGDNLPPKSNLDNFQGLDALTGKSNFDISEWMIRKNIEWLEGRDGLLAMLCKTTAARKVLAQAWRNERRMASASMYLLDAQRRFGVSVDACLLLVRRRPTGGGSRQAAVFPALQAQRPAGVFALQDGVPTADAEAYQKWKFLAGQGFKGWRSGVKHDCSKVFELRLKQGNLVNGLDEPVELEPEVVFPLLKSSDLAAHRSPRSWLIVPQCSMLDDPSRLKLEAPKAWRYLTKHAVLLNKRKSSIYKNRPGFSVFGIGAYSFAPWKVAVSGLHKRLDFVQVPPFQGKPVVLDDTCYFFSCWSEEACRFLYELVTSEPARAFWSSLIFWDAKRPITAQLLNSLNLVALAKFLGKEGEATKMFSAQWTVGNGNDIHQPSLFGAKAEEHATMPPGNGLKAVGDGATASGSTLINALSKG